jgi:hypothetical protein
MGKLAIRTDVERVHYTQATVFSRSIEQLALTERAAADAIQVLRNAVVGLGEAPNGDTKVSVDTKVQ